MTNEEAIEVLQKNKPIADTRECGKELVEACNVAIEALEKADKYKWHDLRKDPKDLPKSDVRYLCARWDYVSNTVFYDLLWFCSGQWCHLDHRREEICDYAVVGWRYIEPFTEDE